MAAVLLREEEAPSWERPIRSPLVLEDYTEVPRPSSTRSRPRRLVKRRWENLLFAAAAAAVLLFFLASFASSLYRSATASYQSPLTHPVVLPVTVHSGDTLWTYAKKYGSPDVYILARVDAIARANHLEADAALVPEQHLLVPVTNPLKIAEIERSHRLAQK